MTWKSHTDLIRSGTVPCPSQPAGTMDPTWAFSDVKAPRSAWLRSDLTNPHVREVLSRKMFLLAWMPYKPKGERPNGKILQEKVLVWVKGQRGWDRCCFPAHQGKSLEKNSKGCLLPAFMSPPALGPKTGHHLPDGKLHSLHLNKITVLMFSVLYLSSRASG